MVLIQPQQRWKTTQPAPGDQLISFRNTILTVRPPPGIKLLDTVTVGRGSPRQLVPSRKKEG